MIFTFFCHDSDSVELQLQDPAEKPDDFYFFCHDADSVELQLQGPAEKPDDFYFFLS